ncbi:MAG: hypothetical protein AAF533_05160 [Acidobacteriota bacterium]
MQQDINAPVPAHLESTVAMVRSAYRDGVPETDLPYLTRLLSEELSFRNLADALSILLGGDPALHLNTAYGVASLDIDDEDVIRVRERLRGHGYHAWLTEEEPEDPMRDLQSFRDRLALEFAETRLLEEDESSFVRSRHQGRVVELSRDLGRWYLQLFEAGNDDDTHPDRWRGLATLAEATAEARSWLHGHPVPRWTSTRAADEYIDTETLRTLIERYLEAVQHLAGQLAALVGVATVDLHRAWCDKRLARTGRLGAAGMFRFHGIGCAIDDGTEFVDFDFTPGGGLDGFDAWRLHVFAVENGLEKRLDADLSHAALRQALTDLAESGAIERVSDSNLYRWTCSS